VGKVKRRLLIQMPRHVFVSYVFVSPEEASSPWVFSLFDFVSLEEVVGKKIERGGEPTCVEVSSSLLFDCAEGTESIGKYD
jgi:hypothetical protein